MGTILNRQHKSATKDGAPWATKTVSLPDEGESLYGRPGRPPPSSSGRHCVSEFLYTATSPPQEGPTMHYPANTRAPWILILREIMRPILKKRALRDPEFLAQMENWLRIEQRNSKPPSLFSHDGILRNVARLHSRYAPKDFRHLLERTHRRVLKGAPEEALRAYHYRGYKVVHDVRHTAEWNTYIRGQHEPGVSHWLRCYAEKARTALDIGANVGIFSLDIVSAMNTNGKVFAFEPNPHVADMLERIIHLNSLENRIIPIRCALSSENTTLPLHVPIKNAGAASLDIDYELQSTVDVPVRTFISWWEEHGRPHIDLVKIDVEGHEQEVLKGMWDYISQVKPTLVVELSSRSLDRSDIIGNLKDAGYHVRRVTHAPPYVEDLSSKKLRQMDLLCESEPSRVN